MTLKVRLYILLTSAIVLASCSSNDVETTVEKTAVKINLAAGIDQLTARGATDLLQNSLSVNSRVAIYINEMTSTTPTVTYLQPMHYRATNTNGDLAPVTGNAPYYPMNGNYVEVVGFYPYSAATSAGGSFTMGNKQVEKADYEANDLMSASVVGRDENNALVLSFKHLCSKISYHLTTSQENVRLISSKVKLLNVKKTALLNAPEGKIVSVVGGSENDILISNDGSKDGSGVILPQTILANTRFIEIELLTKETVYGVMPTTYTFLPGKSYVFNIDVKVDRQTSVLNLTNIEVVDWVDAYSDPQEIVAERTE